MIIQLHDDNAELTLWADESTDFPRLTLLGGAVKGNIWLSLAEERRLATLLRHRQGLRADWEDAGGE